MKWTLLTVVLLYAPFTQCDNPPAPWIHQSFDEAMRLKAYPKAIGVTKHIMGLDGAELYCFFKRLYEKHNVTQLRKIGLDMEEKIPRIIHQIWIGGPLPEEFKEL